MGQSLRKRLPVHFRSRIFRNDFIPLSFYIVRQICFPVNPDRIFIQKRKSVQRCLKRILIIGNHRINLCGPVTEKSKSPQKGILILDHLLQLPVINRMKSDICPCNGFFCILSSHQTDSISVNGRCQKIFYFLSSQTAGLDTVDDCIRKICISIAERANSVGDPCGSRQNSYADQQADSFS